MDSVCDSGRRYTPRAASFSDETSPWERIVRRYVKLKWHYSRLLRALLRHLYDGDDDEEKGSAQVTHYFNVRCYVPRVTFGATKESLLARLRLPRYTFMIVTT